MTQNISIDMANRNDEFELLGKDNSNNNTVEEEFTHT